MVDYYSVKKMKIIKMLLRRVIPDILIKNDCESIGGIDEMTITHIRPEIKKKLNLFLLKSLAGLIIYLMKFQIDFLQFIMQI